jgi:hypothetical protein
MSGPARDRAASDPRPRSRILFQDALEKARQPACASPRFRQALITPSSHPLDKRRSTPIKRDAAPRTPGVRRNLGSSQVSRDARGSHCRACYAIGATIAMNSIDFVSLRIEPAAFDGRLLPHFVKCPVASLERSWSSLHLLSATSQPVTGKAICPDALLPFSTAT